MLAPEERLMVDRVHEVPQEVPPEVRQENNLSPKIPQFFFVFLQNMIFGRNF